MAARWTKEGQVNGEMWLGRLNLLLHRTPVGLSGSLLSCPSNGFSCHRSAHGLITLIDAPIKNEISKIRLSCQFLLRKVD